MEGLPGGRIIGAVVGWRAGCDDGARCSGHWRRLESSQRGVQTAERRIRLLDLRQGIVDRPAVLAADQKIPQHFRVAHVPGGEYIADGEEIPERLRHLLVIDIDEAVVHPHVREMIARRRAGLRDLVLVVRELQIHAARVDIEVSAQNFSRHHRTLDVPTRASFAPGRRPRGLTGLGALPEHKIKRIALALLHFDPRARAQISEALARELPVVRKARHGVHHIAIARHIRVTLLDQRFSERDHAGHVLGGPRLMIGAQNIQPIVVLVHRRDVARREGVDGLAELRSATDDLVVDVGDVAHEDDAIPTMREVTSHHIERDFRAGVADMAEVIDRIATEVHAYLALANRAQEFLLAGERIVDVDRHEASRSRRCRARVAPMSLSSGASSGPCPWPVSA